MIPVPSGWSLEHLPDAICLGHPRGRDVARIHYKERGGQPRRVRALAGEILGGWPQLTVTSLGPIERLTTAEGELGATLGASGALAGRAVQLELGFVLTDDFFSSTLSMCFAPELAGDVRAVLRDLIRQDNLALGIRRRRFEYRPPERWQPVRRGLATEWLAPRYPAHDTTLLVYPANPISVVGRASFGSAHSYLEGLGWQVISVGPVERGTTPNGLTFERQDVVFRHATLPSRRTRIVVLEDSKYQYPMELRMVTSAEPERDQAALGAVMDSVVPFAPSVPLAFQHWID